jgi:hypothetical protein
MAEREIHRILHREKYIEGGGKKRAEKQRLKLWHRLDIYSIQNKHDATNIQLTASGQSYL